MIAVIPVRAGSKSIPHKNIKRIAGKPLVGWVIDAALEAESVERIIVTTDDAAIAELVRSIGAERRAGELTVHRRSPTAATDTATTEVAMEEALQSCSPGATICLLQATSPLTTGRDIDAAAHEFSRGGWDSLVSVVPQHRFIWHANEEGAAPLNYEPSRRPRRQEMAPLLVENGAIYITERQRLADSGSRLSGRIGVYRMHPSTYFEVDEPDDWPIIDMLLRRQRGRELHQRARRVKLLFTDVDGVLTDSGMYWSSDGSELKKFSARDGKGFELLWRAGIEVVMITSEKTELVRRRAEKLRAKALLDCDDKVAAADDLRQRGGLSWDEVGFIGDDVHDARLLAMVGFSAAPCDAVERVIGDAVFVTRARGGEGCFREVADFLLSARKPDSD